MSRKCKSILIIVSAVLAVALITGAVFLILNNIGDPTVSINSKSAKAGEMVEISLSVDKNPGIWGGQVILKYDSDALSFDSYSNGKVFDRCDCNDDSGTLTLLLTQAELKNAKKNGRAAIIRFKINDNAAKGDYNISFNKDTNFCNADEKLIEPTLENGTVTVK